MNTLQTSDPSVRASTMVNGRTRTYTVTGRPDRMNNPPLILVFHGSKQTGEKHRKFTGHSFDALASGEGAVVVYPDGYKGNWNDARKESYFPARLQNIDDTAFTKKLIEELKTSHGIDERRVFAVGYSNGGQMVMRLILETPHLLAGAAIISATLPSPENLTVTVSSPAIASIPVLLMHGTKDPIVPFDGGHMRKWAQRLFKVSGSSLSMPETARYFARRNRILAEPETLTISPKGDARGLDSVDQTDYRDGVHPPVRLLAMNGSGHTIAGPKKAPFILGRTNTHVSAASVVGEFFSIKPANQAG